MGFVTSNSSPLPLTSKCWCGCQRQTTRGAFWYQGHDKIAEAALNALEHEDSVARRLYDRGYGPDHPVIVAAVQTGRWTTCTRCGYPGRPESVRLHQSKYPNCETTAPQPWPTNPTA